MDDAERQSRIGELLRIRLLQADTAQTMDKCLGALGHSGPITEQDIRGILDSAAVPISSKPSEGSGGLVACLLQALDNKANGDDFRRVLEEVPADIAVTPMEGPR